ncbi:hypothetical protein K469DRAFT_709243 [Zopfia rhizophila CBS 207.26]|uniref:Uncharacterized protein n=1 Tax=Zopfia rhizophila CBS 207.26 TaxID=1314779 RepID=A0A6A6E192_9PEZI|nr:hypothetical protein K469DRAFT_709243 [Zopfia rhizophila CBS 207.26]
MALWLTLNKCDGDLRLLRSYFISCVLLILDTLFKPTQLEALRENSERLKAFFLSLFATYIVVVGNLFDVSHAQIVKGCESRERD